MSVKWADHVGNNLMVVQKVINRTAKGPSCCSPESTYEIGFISVALAKASPKEISGEVVNFIFKFPGYSALSR